LNWLKHVSTSSTFETVSAIRCNRYHFSFVLSTPSYPSLIPQFCSSILYILLCIKRGPCIKDTMAHLSWYILTSKYP
jgi:hypothetical protein